MENACFLFPLLILLLNFVTLSFCAPIFNSTLSTDKHALLSFKSSIVFLSGSGATLSANWSEETSVCDWIGVSCGLKHRRVTALNLSGFGLAGTLSPHLGDLMFLRYLNISSNNFTGILPFEFSKLKRLKVMDASTNSFTGDIPTWVGRLPQLEQLILFRNSFSGKIPPSLFHNSTLQVLRMSHNLLIGDIPKEIGNTCCLKIIKFHYNHLSGNIPSEIGNLSMLEDLHLNSNDFRGRLPEEIGKLLHLEELIVDSASLSGTIPPSIFNISSLTLLSFSNNSFSGSIPTLLNLPKLQKLYLDNNKLTGNIPSSIFNISSLTLVYLSYNNFSGELPQEIGSVHGLKIFSVFQNSLSGSIPSSISNLSTLKELELSFNQFSGTLPWDMGNSLLNLDWLLLHTNMLNGPIPISITNASKIVVLDMEHNSFSGSVPNFGNLRHLQVLFIGGNNLSGAESPTHELTFLTSLTKCRYLKHLQIGPNPLNGILPASIGNFSASLLNFYAYGSNIKGVIPSEIGNLSSLIDLRLQENQLTGLIPPTIGKMKRLQQLILNGNQLEGSIPNDICELSNMGALFFDGNNLVGPIPECLGDVKPFREIYLNSNQLNSTIPSNFWSLKDLLFLDLSSNYFSGQLPFQLANLKSINSLDLSFNQFSGDIPSTIDGCQSLEFLNLSNNEFSGVIPESIGNIRSLKALDLSNNSLLGSLPKSLANIKSLLDFNVSYNRMEGEIPDEGCFVNFTAQSFVNNFALCGPTRFHVPPCSKNHEGSRVKSFMKLMKYILPLVIFIVVLVTISALMNTRRKNKRKAFAPTTNIFQCIEWRRISYIELERGTSSFGESNLLGSGSFGSVFLATLSDGLKVAAKVFNLQLERAAQSFDTESEILSTIRHRNIVRVIGCCSNMEFKALILEYMPNGSLEKWLHSDTHCLDLMQRVKIAIDVALALKYLHDGYTHPIVHCDVKPSNVLLDEDMTARISDFGIAKLFENGEDVVQTKTLATIGYAAPEYGSEGKVSTNGDVYSYGIMLLEMFTGKRPTDDMFMGEMSLKSWVSEALQKGVVSEVADPHLVAREDQHFLAKELCVSSIFELAMKCVAFSPVERINMIEAVASLKKIKAKFEVNTRRRRR